MRESVKILRQAIKEFLAVPENLEAKRLATGPKSEWNGFDYQYISKIAPRLRPQGEHCPSKVERGWAFI